MNKKKKIKIESKIHMEIYFIKLVFIKLYKTIFWGGSTQTAIIAKESRIERKPILINFI